MNEMAVLVEDDNSVYFNAEQVMTMLDNSNNLSAVRDDLRALLITAKVDAAADLTAVE